MAHAMITPSNHKNHSRIADSRANWQAWLVVVVASLFFFYEFVQMNLFDVINQPVREAFHLNAAGVSAMSAWYFWANVIFLFPAGVLLDRCSARKIILVTLGICLVGTTAFAMAHSLEVAIFSRFLEGIGSAFCFLSVLRLASRWFPPRRMAMVTGMIVTIAMAGGMMAQTPMHFLVKAVHWRDALLIDAVVGVGLFVLIALIVKDYPAGTEQFYEEDKQKAIQLGYWKSLRIAFLRLQNWLGGIYTCLMNLPVLVLGGMWGVSYLVTADNLSRLDATYVTSMLFLGTIIGGPLVGAISDRIGLRRMPMILGAVGALVFTSIVLYTNHLSFSALIALFLMVGLTTSAQIIGYPLVAESSPREVTAMSVSVVNINCQAGIAIFLPVFGYLIDIHQLHFAHHITTKFLPGDFHWAMMIFPIGMIIALAAAFAVKETYCRTNHEHVDVDVPTEEVPVSA